MLDEMLGTYGSNLTIAVVGVAAGFLCLILVLWLIRGRGGPSPFLRGGKNRQPRLQVLDAAAVDTRRRLVLVRRDDVEHLIMIGGPTDVVIESSIVDGRSPPYHTMMKTVSDREQASIAAAEEPRAAEPAARAASLSAPAPRVAAPVAPVAKAEPSAQVETKDNFAWLASETEQAETARAVAPAQPEPRKPEAPKPAAPAVTAAQPNTPKTEQRSPETTQPAEPAPVLDFPATGPRPTATAAIGAAPMVTAFAAAPAPAVSSPAPAPRESAPAISIDISPKAADAHFEIDPPRPANDTPSLDNAANLLDAARERVFQQPRTETAPVTVPVQNIASSAAPTPSASVSMRQSAPVAAPAKPLGSDFERILEEEMASNLASANAAPSVGAAATVAPAGHMPRRDPNLARVTGATQEPAMQNEIARIFGEMSVTKDDR